MYKPPPNHAQIAERGPVTFMGMNAIIFDLEEVAPTATFIGAMLVGLLKKRTDEIEGGQVDAVAKDPTGVRSAIVLTSLQTLFNYHIHMTGGADAKSVLNVARKTDALPATEHASFVAVWCLPAQPSCQLLLQPHMNKHRQLQ